MEILTLIIILFVMVFCLFVGNIHNLLFRQLPCCLLVQKVFAWASKPTFHFWLLHLFYFSSWYFVCLFVCFFVCCNHILSFFAGVPDEQMRLKKMKDVISMFLPLENCMHIFCGWLLLLFLIYWCFLFFLIMSFSSGKILKFLLDFLYEVSLHSNENKVFFLVVIYLFIYFLSRWDLRTWEQCLAPLCFVIRETTILSTRAWWFQASLHLLLRTRTFYSLSHHPRNEVDGKCVDWVVVDLYFSFTFKPLNIKQKKTTSFCNYFLRALFSFNFHNESFSFGRNRSKNMPCLLVRREPSFSLSNYKRFDFTIWVSCKVGLLGGMWNNWKITWKNTKMIAAADGIMLGL